MPRIFFSYARRDVELIRPLRHLLERQYDVWFDERLVGQGGRPWWDTILKEIRECDVFVQTLSPASLASQACTEERGYALALSRPMVPVVVALLESDPLPPDVRPFQVIDYVDAPAGRRWEVSKAIADATPGAPLPDPLPPPPPLPVSGLIPVSERLRASPLVDEAGLIRQLEYAATDERERDTAVRLLGELKARPDLSPEGSRDVERVLSSPRGTAEPAPPRPVRAPAVRAARRPRVSAGGTGAVAVVPAPLSSGDGWRLWYSWPGGDFTPATPQVRTAAGTEVGVLEGPWVSLAGGTGAREIRLVDAVPGERYDVTVPELGRPASWRTLPFSVGASGIKYLVAPGFWRVDDRAAPHARAANELRRRESPSFQLLLGEPATSAPVRPGELDPAVREALAGLPTRICTRAAEDPASLLHTSRSAQWDIPPLSFLSASTYHDGSLLEEQLRDVEQWVQRLQGPGALALPRPLLDLPDIIRITSALERTEHDVLVLSTDDGGSRLRSLTLTGYVHTIYELVVASAGRAPSADRGRTRELIGHRFVEIDERMLDPGAGDALATVRVDAGRNGRYRLSLRLWRATPATVTVLQPIHDELSLELR